MKNKITFKKLNPFVKDFIHTWRMYVNNTIVKAYYQIEGIYRTNERKEPLPMVYLVVIEGSSIGKTYSIQEAKEMLVNFYNEQHKFS